MPYTLNKDGTPLLDQNGNKIEYHIEYFDIDDWYKHREPIHINDDGHLDSENRHLLIKEGINQNHAVNKKQIDQLKQDIDNKLLALQNSITSKLQIHEAKILVQMLNFRNEQIKNRIQRKYLTIPKTPNKEHILLSYTEINGETDLRNIVILNVWISRKAFHHSKSSDVEKEFGNSLEHFYNESMTTYSIYFTQYPSNWDMKCIVEWLRIPQPISIDDSNTPSKSDGNE